MPDCGKGKGPEQPPLVVNLDATAPMAVEIVRIVKNLPAEKQREVLEFAKKLSEQVERFSPPLR